VRGGEAGHPGLEPGKLRDQSPAGLPIPPMAIEYGRRESNAQAANFELARSAGLQPLPRAPPENRTLFAGLRVRSITIYACGT
jgi:hypothetical protein